MWRFGIIIIMLGATACHSGLIPCPTVKPIKYAKASPKRVKALTFHADASQAQEHKKPTQPYVRGRQVKEINGVSIEEWDCPRPGEKRYMPRSVKSNIRKNLKKVYQQSDSTHVR